jgi:hypothetical protein
MTTVAACFSKRQIAADSMCSGEGEHYLVQKLRYGKTSIFGAAGDWDEILKFYQAMEKDGELDSECDIDVLELRDDGIYVYSSCVIPAKIKNDFFAIGSGSAYAIAAMHLGKTPAEAVAIAALYDPGTRGPIDVAELPKKRSRAKSNDSSR